MAQTTQMDVSSALPATSNIINPTEDTPSPTNRQPYRRESSWQGQRNQYQNVSLDDHGSAQQIEHENASTAHGLGLSNVAKPETVTVVRRVPVGSRPDTTFSYLTPEISRDDESFSQTTTARNTGDINARANNWTSTPQSSHYSLADSVYRHEADNINLLRKQSHENHDHSHAHPADCPTEEGLLKEKWSWLTWVFIVLAFYTTIFSAIFLVIAIAKPRWGHRLGPRNALSYNSATFLSAFISKTIELSFATTFVATLGQILSRRAFARDTARKGGISIAEMNMRLWIMQPGTLITHWSGVKYVITTLIGITALSAAFAATFYTTAAEALVAPKLKYGKNETVTLYGQVSASYANSLYLSQHCETPMTTQIDPMYSGNTCLQIEYAGNAFRNFGSWRSAWAERQRLKMGEDAGKRVARPLPISILYENTTVTGQWIGNAYDDIERDSAKFGRMVQNITMVMPHANVYHAARDQVNSIIQPDDLGGAGEYYLKAAVPVPALNALCVGAATAEIQLLIGNATHPPAKWPVETPFDQFFGWIQNSSTQVGEMAPMFGKLPIDYNTLVNVTANWGTQWVYLLAKASPTVTPNDNSYTLCGIRSYQYLDCSTTLLETKSGGQLSVNCGNDAQVWKKYSETKNASLSPSDGTVPTVQDSKDFKDIGAEWIRSISLGQGIADGNASIARFLTQSTPAYISEKKESKLSVNLPSIAEGLSVLAGYTLLMGSDAAPFIHFWSWDPKLSPVLDPPQVQAIEAYLSYKDFSSGYDANWKGVFYVILVLVFAINLFCLITLLRYYIVYGEVTDYTEPQNLFALAINSPRSRFLAGACGGGPSGDVIGKKWCVEMSRPTAINSNTPDPNKPLASSENYDNPPRSPYAQHQNSDVPHFYVRYPGEELPSQEDLDEQTANNTAANTPNPQSRLSRFMADTLGSRQRDPSEGSPRPGQRKTTRFASVRRPKGSPMEQMEFEEGAQSPAVTQYMKLTGGRS